jgi:hypothetical protein
VTQPAEKTTDRHVAARGDACSLPVDSRLADRVAPALDPDLEAHRTCLKLAAIRRMAPQVLRTAKTWRWAPDELLRSVVRLRHQRQPHSFFIETLNTLWSSFLRPS